MSPKRQKDVIISPPGRENISAKALRKESKSCVGKRKSNKHGPNHAGTGELFKITDPILSAAEIPGRGLGSRGT